MSACAQPVAPPKTVSDFCLNDRAIAVAVAPAEDFDDRGNLFDTDATVDALLEHNAAWRRVCDSG